MVDEEVKEYVSGQLAQHELKIRAYLDGECKPCRSHVEGQLVQLRQGVALRESEQKVFTMKLDQVHADVTKVANLLEGNGHGSIDTQLQLMHQEQEHLRESVNTLLNSKKEETVDRKETFRRALIASIPQFLQWIAMGIVLLFWFAFHTPQNTTSSSTTTSTSVPSPVTAPKTP